MRFVALSFSVLALAAVEGCATEANESVAPAQAEMLAVPSTTIVSCADAEDPTMTAELTVEPGARFGWRIGEMSPEVSAVAEVVRNVQDGTVSYSFHLASGRFVSLSMSEERVSVSFSALYASCSGKTAVSESVIRPLLEATAASEARKQTFATCKFHGDGAEVPEQDTFTVRPSLDGHGAIFEDDSKDSDQTFVLLARQVDAAASSQRSTYKGEGGVAIFAAGQHVSPVTELTFTGASPATVQWNWQEELPSSECQVTGTEYASSLIH
jgi:hypothetical protein